MAKVLIIESDEGTRYLYKTAIKFQHIEVKTSATVADGLNKIEKFRPTLILLDVMIDDLKDIDILKEIKKKINDTLPLIILTDMRTKDAQKEASIFGACEYLSKSEGVGELIKKVRGIVEEK